MLARGLYVRARLFLCELEGNRRLLEGYILEFEGFYASSRVIGAGSRVIY